MAFLRFSRDKRGYEHFYLVEPSTRRGKPRPRVLYWYRTPPGVRVGREPFDASMRRLLEAQYPGVVFDWQEYVDMPIPPIEPEHWRERRRAEKAAKLAARADAAAELEAAENEASASETSRPGPEVDEVKADSQPALDTAAPAEEPAQTAPAADGTLQPAQPPRRRRRRRRGRRSPIAAAQVGLTEPGQPGESSEVPGGVKDAEAAEPAAFFESEEDGEV